ncbi:hypothetical protein OTU49_008700, partial [Cherax quadricarinatus]
MHSNTVNTVLNYLRLSLSSYKVGFCQDCVCSSGVEQLELFVQHDMDRGDKRKVFHQCVSKCVFLSCCSWKKLSGTKGKCTVSDSRKMKIMTKKMMMPEVLHKKM